MPNPYNPDQTEREYAMTTIDNESTAIEVVKPPPPPPDHSRVTAGQAKVEAVANLTFKAYERASTLVLTPEELKGLQEPFPDEAFRTGAAGKENLIYVEHSALRDRLNRVIGIGQWSIIPRSRWAVDGVTQKGTAMSTVYVEAMLVVRGAYVSEAIGDMVYYPDSAGTNYGDAVEGAKSAALRRCLKEFGVGLQAWSKEWTEGWWRRHNAPKTAARTDASPALKPAPSEPPIPTVAGTVGVVINNLPNQTTDESAGTCIVHFGKNKGVAVKDLSPQSLHWYAEEWQPKPFNGAIDHKTTYLKEATIRYRRYLKSLKVEQPAANPDDDLTP